MFDEYDDKTKEYIIINSEDSEESLTAQELYHFYIMNDIGINESFELLKRKLDNGEEIRGKDYQYDWSLGVNVCKGMLTIKKRKLLKSTTISPVIGNCNHPNKYINQAGGKRFYVCPNCKADLGDA